MARAFLVVMDSVGIGGAPDAGDYFNAGTPDTGANTLGHIAEWCAGHRSEGPLRVPNLAALGLGPALEGASGMARPELDVELRGTWAHAREQSRGKDTPSGHWELAGLPVPWDWHYFPADTPAFPDTLTKAICTAAGTTGILGNCHASGAEIVDRLGSAHIETGHPICYTSADSVLQIAAHEDHFGLDRLIRLCADVAPLAHEMRVGRVIARPFLGSHGDFARTGNRKDFAIKPPAPVLMNWVQDAGGQVHALGKIGDIFSMTGIDDCEKGSDARLMQHLKGRLANAKDGSLTFANFVEFDTDFGHRRDPAGYVAHLEWFDAELAYLLGQMRAEDLMIITADHGNDPTWVGTDHTREQVPVLIAGHGPGSLGQIAFADVAKIIAGHLDLAPAL